MIKKILLGIILNGLALYMVTLMLDGIVYTGGTKFFIIAGLIIGGLNTFIKPLMKILSFPFIFMTAGFFIVVINAIIFWLTVKMVNAISILDITMVINDPWTYLWAALIFGLVNWVLHLLIHNK
jgi:putative membrane protein